MFTHININILLKYAIYKSGPVSWVGGLNHISRQ